MYNQIHKNFRTVQIHTAPANKTIWHNNTTSVQVYAKKNETNQKWYAGKIHTNNATWSQHSLISHSTSEKLFRRRDGEIKSTTYIYSTHATRAVSIYWTTHTNVQFMQWPDALSVIKMQFMPCSCTVTLADDTPGETWKHNINNGQSHPALCLRLV